MNVFLIRLRFPSGIYTEEEAWMMLLEAAGILLGLFVAFLVGYKIIQEAAWFMYKRSKKK